MKRTLLIVLLTLSYSLIFAQSPCENGLVNNLYPCNQTILMGHLTPEELLATNHGGYYLSSMWGWTDSQTGDEYALVGLTDGVAFVRVTDPVNPIMLGKLHETHTESNRILHGESSWRDIRVYKDHAFIVSDLNHAHGMQIFDLTKLRGVTENQGDTFHADTVYHGVASSHTININEETGYAYIVGSVYYAEENQRCDGLHIVNIQDPKNPIFVTCYSEDGYTHETQTTIYAGPDSDYSGKEISFASNEDTFTIIDVDNKEEISIISRTGYTNSAYTHQGWLTDDHRFYLMNDELDESAYGHNARTYIWNVEDLDNPKIIGSFFNEAAAIDHNLYIKGNLVYESNYWSGLRVLDLDRIETGTLREVAFFDSYPQGDAIEFGGTWTNYPFFESGNILISDMNNGLFIVRLDLETLIESHPFDSVCTRSEAVYSVSVNDEGSGFQWQRLNDTRFVDLPENSKYQGVTSSQLTANLTAADSLMTFRCKITSSSGDIHYSFPSNLPSRAVNQVVNTYYIAEGEIQLEDLSTHNLTSEWIINGGPYSNERITDFQFEEDQESVTVTLISANTCSSDTLDFVIYKTQPLSLQQSDLAPYPNPGTNLIYVGINSPASYRFFDLSGIVFLKGRLDESGSIDITDLHPGVYILELKYSARTVTHRIVKN